MEEEIEKLESGQEGSTSDKSRLVDLKKELEKINKKKEDYVAEHPEHKKLVFKQRRQQQPEPSEETKPVEHKSRNLFNKHGLPKHPERSIYYDPVMNPYGVAPPGMPYMERREYLIVRNLPVLKGYSVALRPDEVDSDQEKQDGGYCINDCVVWVRC